MRTAGLLRVNLVGAIAVLALLWTLSSDSPVADAAMRGATIGRRFAPANARTLFVRRRRNTNLVPSDFNTATIRIRRADALLAVANLATRILVRITAGSTCLT